MKYNIGNNGFLEFIEMFGDELSIVNAARVSFNSEKGELDESDIKLIRYLYKNKHMSPFRHTMFRFKIKAPEFVMRQLYKHVVGIEATSTHPTQLHSWNEISQRYVEVDEYYYPDEWRDQHKSNKQGSIMGAGKNNESAKEEYNKVIANMKESYEKLLSLGVCKEQARMVLPLSVYSTVIWTCSLQAVLNFIELRDEEHSQKEIRDYAIAMKEILKEQMPKFYEVWSKNNDEVAYNTNIVKELKYLKEVIPKALFDERDKEHIPLLYDLIKKE
jgi:thymidylate synthase (FAD)